ncbi:MAG: crossover junction endodeoxyribonuclease RuvC [Alistipes sp.]|nr:crossover junction endodeoxyribonuclease RuvC [Alistipes sp.]
MAAKTIMGIDPGTNITGYGILRTEGNRMECVTLGIIDLHRLTDPYEKLHYIFSRTSALIAEYRPQEVALESPFFGENVQSMLKLGRAQGVAMAAALSQGVQVAEYAPRRIKQALTGQGSATKEQVACVLKSLLKLEELPKRLDATDGLAVAVCHFFQSAPITQIENHCRKKALGGGPTSSQNWDQFIASHPERIRK